MQTKRAFQAGWEQIKTSNTITKDDYFQHKPWQNDCFHLHKNSEASIINAPPGSGKSMVMSSINIHKLKKNEHLRCIMAVPQTIIGSSFRHNRIELPNGNKEIWFPQHDLCKEIEGSKVEYLLDFLRGPNDKNIWQDRILICTHATIVEAFNLEPSLFKNLIINIDEAHHIQYSRFEDLDIGMFNSIGGIVKHAMHEPTNEIHIATATFFRGDQREIIPQKYMSNFKRYDLPCDKYFETLKYLKSISYDFVFYRDNYKNELNEIFKERINGSIVYIPHINSNCAMESKYLDVEEVLKGIANSDNPEIKNEDQPIMQVKRGDRWIKVVNLVDENLREEKKEAIIEAHEHNDSSMIDVIIVLNMLREGANWRWARQVIPIGPKHSLTDVVQTIGRLFRDVPGKEHVHIYHLLPLTLNGVDKEKLCKELNDYLKAIFMSLILEDIFMPPKINFGKGGKNKNQQSRINYLLEIIGDENKAAEVYKRVYLKTLEAIDMNKMLEEDLNKLRDKFSIIVKSVLLEDFDITEYHKEIITQIWNSFQRRSFVVKLNIQGVNVNHIDITLLQKENPLNFLLYYTSDTLGAETFTQLRRLTCQYCWLPFEEAKKYVHNLNLKNQSEWHQYCQSNKKPDNIPSAADRVYKNEWNGWGDWLGTGAIASFNIKFKSYEEVQKIAIDLGIDSKNTWFKYWKKNDRPEDIPYNPSQTYAHQWSGWGDFLETGRIAPQNRKFKSYEEVQKIAIDLGIDSKNAWFKYWKENDKPKDIPFHPERTYANQWEGWGEFLGTVNIHPRDRELVSYEEAKNFVQINNIKSISEWQTFCSEGNVPDNIPHSPLMVYDECKLWNDFLGKPPRSEMKFLPFKNAKEYVHAQNIKSLSKWEEWCKSGEKPDNIPSAADRVYKNEWNGWGDWLNTNNKSGAQIHKYFSPFEEAREYAHNLNFKSGNEWREWAKSNERPDNIPACPNKTYKDQWDGWADWLGTGGKKKTNIEDLKLFAAKYNGRCLSEVYTSERGKYIWECQKHGRFQKAWYSMKVDNGIFCYKCYRENEKNPVHPIENEKCWVVNQESNGDDIGHSGVRVEYLASVMVWIANFCSDTQNDVPPTFVQESKDKSMKIMIKAPNGKIITSISPDAFDIHYYYIPKNSNGERIPIEKLTEENFVNTLKIAFSS